jgi:hypothetical protein
MSSSLLLQRWRSSLMNCGRGRVSIILFVGVNDAKDQRPTCALFHSRGCVHYANRSRRGGVG